MMKRLMDHIFVCAFVCCLFVLPGCSTLESVLPKENPEAKLADDELSDKAGGSMVVQQSGRMTPVISQFDNKYWITLRNSSKDQDRMFGALAVGEWEAAATSARKYLAGHPGDKSALVTLVAALSYGKRYDLASYYAGLLESSAPNNADALNVKGLAVMLAANNRLADYRRAETYFKKSLESSPDEVAAGLNLGHLYLEMGNANAAGLTFDQVTARCGECTDALIGAGLAAGRQGQWEKALETWNKVLSKHPSHSRALYHLALVHRNGYNDNDRAEKILRQLLANHDKGERLLHDRADATLRVIVSEKESHRKRAASLKSSGSAAPEVKVPSDSGSDED